MKPTVAVFELMTDFSGLSLKLSDSNGTIVQVEDVP